MTVTSYKAALLVPGDARHRRLLLRLGQGALALLALFLLFEVGIRHVPPDGMVVSFQDSTLVPQSDGSYVPKAILTTYTYTEPKDQQAIGETYASLNDTSPFNSITTHVNCALTPPPWPSSITFTWHGIVLETWTIEGCAVSDNAGGISDDQMLTVHFWEPIAPTPPA
jgi:hypothetical protein